MIEVEVHSFLRDFLRQHGDRNWPHHLTMARLVARALRLGRPALMQTNSSVGKYCLSYLMPVLVGDWSVIVVAPAAVQQYLLETEIPLLQKWLATDKQIRAGDRWKDTDDLLLTTPESWLRDRLNREGRFPDSTPVIIDRAHDIVEITQKILTISLNVSDWEELRQKASPYAELIRNSRAKLTKEIFAHPRNPYESYILDESESAILDYLCRTLAAQKLLTRKFSLFWQQWQQDKILWTSRDLELGLFSISLAPIQVKKNLAPIWQQQPFVIVGDFLDLEPTAPIYRQQLGLPDLLSLKFSPNRQNEHIQLYLPNRFPMHNTPQFAKAFIEQTRMLASLSQNSAKSVIILVENVPLQAQVGSVLAAEFGSRVKVEKLPTKPNAIIVCSWSFWQSHQLQLPAPQLLIVATIPLPSPENPLVASRVAYYKKTRQDWFSLYFLPTALKTMQQAIVPLRESQGVVALLDNRVKFRSYGKTILSALEPYARSNYIDPSWFGYGK